MHLMTYVLTYVNIYNIWYNIYIYFNLQGSLFRGFFGHSLIPAFFLGSLNSENPVTLVWPHGWKSDVFTNPFTRPDKRHQGGDPRGMSFCHKEVGFFPTKKTRTCNKNCTVAAVRKKRKLGGENFRITKTKTHQNMSQKEKVTERTSHRMKFGDGRVSLFCRRCSIWQCWSFTFSGTFGVHARIIACALPVGFRLWRWGLAWPACGEASRTVGLDQRILVFCTTWWRWLSLLVLRGAGLRYERCEVYRFLL